MSYVSKVIRGISLVFLISLFSQEAYAQQKFQDKRVSESEGTAEKISSEQLKQRQKQYKIALKYLQSEVKEAVKISENTVTRTNSQILPGKRLENEVLKEENFVFSQDMGIKDNKLKTKLGVKLGKTRDLERITTDISYHGTRIRTDHNTLRNQHTVRGSTKVAGINTNLALYNDRSPALSASKTLKIGKISSITPTYAYDFEKKNHGFGVNSSIYFISASVFNNSSPMLRITDYTVQGNIKNTVKIKLHSREMSRPENPDSFRRTYDGSMSAKLNKNTSLQASCGYVNGQIVNPTIKINFVLRK